MPVTMATSPGHGRPNEDFVGAVPGALVMLDGAGIPGSASICSHGTAWYTHTLGSCLLGRLSRGSGLVAALADSIEEVAGLHRHTCDLAHTNSPQAAVAAVKVVDDRLDYLLLADAYVVLDLSAGPDVVTDPREVEVRGECLRLTSGVVEAFRARRNRPGGFWIAKDSPEAAAQAVTGAVPLASLRGYGVLSNGAARLVDPYARTDRPGLVALLRDAGPDEVIRQVRAHEGATTLAEGPDDATAAYAALPVSQSSSSSSSM